MAHRTDQPIETIAGWTGLVAEMDSIEPDGDPLDNSRMLSSEASTSPKKRTSPSRPESAIAMAFFNFATSIPANASLSFATARIGSASPSNPQTLSVERATSTTEADIRSYRTGKSAVIEELAARGHRAVDLDTRSGPNGLTWIPRPYWFHAKVKIGAGGRTKSERFSPGTIRAICSSADARKTWSGSSP